MAKTELHRTRTGARGSRRQARPIPEAGQPETVRVRMTVDLVGPIADELERTAQTLGKSKTDLVREGLGYIFRALQARDEGYYVGAWKEEPDGKVSRAREFPVGA